MGRPTAVPRTIERPTAAPCTARETCSLKYLARQGGRQPDAAQRGGRQLYPMGQGGLSTLPRVMEDIYIHTPCNKEAGRHVQRREGHQPYLTRQGDCTPCDEGELSQATAAAVFLIHV